MPADDVLADRFEHLVRELDAPSRSDVVALERRIGRRRRHLTMGSGVAIAVVLAVLVGAAWVRSGSPQRETLQPSPDSPPVGEAYRTCKASAAAAGDLVAAAYPATVAQARALIERTQSAVSSGPLAGLADDDPVVICYANGPVNRAWYPETGPSVVARQDAVLLGGGEVVTFGLHPDAMFSVTVPPSATMGTIDGRLLPVEAPGPGVVHQVGGPTAGTVTLQREDDPSVIVGLDVPPGGSFVVGLAPGRYLISGSSTSLTSAAASCQSDSSPIDVALRGDLQLDVLCQIR